MKASSILPVLSLMWALTPVRAAAVQIGEKAGDLHFKDIRFVERSQKDLGTARAYVIAFTTVDCPVVQRYLPKLNDLHHAYKTNGVVFLGMNVGIEDSIKQVAYQAIEH